MVSEVLQVGSGLVLVALGAFAVDSARPAARRMAALVTAADLDPARPDGSYGRLAGTAEPTEEVAVAPFTGRRSLAYDCAVEQEGDELLETNTVSTEAAAVPFDLAADGRTVRVDPADATVELAADRTVDVPGGEAPPERVQAYDERAGLAPQHTPVGDVVELSTGWDREYHEGVIAPGDEVAVYGHLRRPKHPDPSVDAVVDGGEPTFLLTDHGPLVAAFHAEWRPVVVAVSGVAAVLVGTWMLAVTPG